MPPIETFGRADTSRIVAATGAAWAYFDSVVRNAPAEALAGLLVFKASWNAGVGGLLSRLSTGAAVPTSLSPASGFDRDARNAIRLAIASVGQWPTGRGVEPFASGELGAEAVNGMPSADPFTTQAAREALVDWWNFEIASRFPEDAEDEIVQLLWSCARVVDGAGVDAGSRLQARVMEIETGSWQSVTGITGGANSANAQIAQLLARAGSGGAGFPQALPLATSSSEAPTPIELPEFRITGRRTTDTTIPWPAIAVGTGVLALASILAYGAYRRRKGRR